MTSTDLFKLIDQCDINKGEILIPNVAYLFKRGYVLDKDDKLTDDLIILVQDGITVGGIRRYGSYDIHLVMKPEYENKHIMSSFLKTGIINKLWPENTHVDICWEHPEEISKKTYLAGLCNMSVRDTVFIKNDEIINTKLKFLDKYIYKAYGYNPFSFNNRDTFVKGMYKNDVLAVVLEHLDILTEKEKKYSKTRDIRFDFSYSLREYIDNIDIIEYEKVFTKSVECKDFIDFINLKQLHEYKLTVNTHSIFHINIDCTDIIDESIPDIMRLSQGNGFVSSYKDSISFRPLAQHISSIIHDYYDGDNVNNDVYYYDDLYVSYATCGDFVKYVNIGTRYTLPLTIDNATPFRIYIDHANKTVHLMAYSFENEYINTEYLDSLETLDNINKNIIQLQNK